jgi:hypothetical protein
VSPRSADASSPLDPCGHVPRQTMFSTSSAAAIRLLARTSARSALRAPVSRGHASLSVAGNARPRFAGTGRLVFGSVLLASFALATARVYTDAQAESSNLVSMCGTVSTVGFTDAESPAVDPSTSIAFPKTMHIPSTVPIPDLTLVGVGVRTVSFLRVKVYSVGFYADLNNPALKVGSCLRLGSLHAKPRTDTPVSHSRGED